VLEKVGHIFLSQRDYHRALENFEHQLIIANSFIDEPSGIVDCMRIRSRAKVNMGDVWAERSILAICLKLYIASLQIDTEVLGMTGRVPDSLRDVSISQERIAKVYHSLGRSTSASSMYEMCLEIRLEILALTGNRPDSLLDLAQCYGNIAVFKGELGKIECLRAFELFAELAKDYPSVDQFAEGMAKTRVLAATFNWNLPASD
jgi:tetratricopeptide (TPR) repeat protein